MTVKDILLKATKEHWSTGHFNASEFDQIRAIVEACAEVETPAIIGTSEGERKHLGLLEAMAVVAAFRKEFDIPVFLNADHTKSVDVARAAVDAGYDSIHIDLSALTYEENIAGTKEIVAYALAKSTGEGTEISVEGELGYLRGESKIQQEKIEVSPDDYTKPEEAKEFVERTGVNRLAVVVGNIHGISIDEPNLDVERIRAIREILPKEVALVLHGGSGIPDNQMRAAIAAGIANVHINTDLRVAYVGELRKSLAEHLDEVAMYKLDSAALDAMKKVILQKLEVFGAVKKI